MDPLFVMTASDGSSLILGQDPADPQQPFRLVFCHEGDGAPEPLRGALPAFWVTILGKQHIVFAGDTLDEPTVDRVLLEFPTGEHGSQTCRVRNGRWRAGIWMSWPQPFGEGAIEPGTVVTARWLTRDNRVHAIRRTEPLEWGEPVPPIVEPPDDPDLASRYDDESHGASMELRERQDGGTSYSPG